eukprot:3057432-Prorocentrum_lima.AAC.1
MLKRWLISALLSSGWQLEPEWSVPPALLPPSLLERLGAVVVGAPALAPLAGGDAVNVGQP